LHIYTHECHGHGGEKVGKVGNSRGEERRRRSISVLEHIEEPVQDDTLLPARALVVVYLCLFTICPPCLAYPLSRSRVYNFQTEQQSIASLSHCHPIVKSPSRSFISCSSHAARPFHSAVILIFTHFVHSTQTFPFSTCAAETRYKSEWVRSRMVMVMLMIAMKTRRSFLPFYADCLSDCLAALSPA